jgi:hypothetical protein
MTRPRKPKNPTEAELAAAHADRARADLAALATVVPPKPTEYDDREPTGQPSPGSVAPVQESYEAALLGIETPETTRERVVSLRLRIADTERRIELKEQRLRHAGTTTARRGTLRNLEQMERELLALYAELYDLDADRTNPYVCHCGAECADAHGFRLHRIDHRH